MSAAITSTNVLAVTPAPASTPAGSASTNKGAFADLMKQVLATALPGAGKEAQQQDGQGTPKDAKADQAAPASADGAAPAAPAAAPVLPVAVVDGTFALATAMSAPTAGIVVAATAAAVEPADALADTRLSSAPVDGAAAAAKTVATVALGQTVPAEESVVTAKTAAQNPALPVGRQAAPKPGMPAAAAPAATSSPAVATAAAALTAADPASTKPAGPSPVAPAAQPHAAKEPLAAQSAAPAPAPAQGPSATPAATTPASDNVRLETAPAIAGAQAGAPVEPAKADSTATSTVAQGPALAAPTGPAAAPAMPASFAPLATAHTSAPAAQIPVPATFATQVTKQVFTLATTAAPGEHVMVLKVTPENLGPVTVQAHITGTSVRIELFAPTDAGRDAIRQVMPDLKRDIASSGLQTQLDLSSGNHPGAQQGDTGRNAFNQRGFAPNPGTPSNRQLVVDAHSSAPRPGLSGTDAVLDVMA